MTGGGAIYTIGAYGFTADTFHAKLRSAKIDRFIDVRARRGVRGAEYAFANAKRLQAALAEAGIAYTHAPDLAPTDAMRQAQYAADAAAGVGKRTRTQLGPAFVAAYQAERLAEFDAQAFAEEHIAGARRPVLFCVERDPAACHRALLAKRLKEDLGLRVEHLMP